MIIEILATDAFSSVCVCYVVADIRKQLNDQIGSLEFRTESKIALLNDLQEFFKRRSEVEVEYARGLDRLVEKCEKSTKQRNVK